MSAQAGAPLRAGLYGRGAFGAFLVKSLADSRDVCIAAVASRSPERAREFASAHGIERACESYEAMLALSELDLAIIATPPVRHAPDALAAIEAGKHVLIEKPLATAVEDAKRVLAAAAQSRRVVGIDYPMPYTDIVRALGELTRSRAAGKLRRIVVENIASREGLSDDHWFWDRGMSGGIFVEHGVHFFDWCGHLLDPARSVAGWTAAEGAREDRVFAAVDHADGALATYYHAFIATSATERTSASLYFDACDAVAEGWIPIRLTLSGAAAEDAARVLRTLHLPNLSHVRSGNGAIIFDAGDKLSAYARGIADVCADFRRAAADPNHKRLVDESRALESLRVADAARRAAATGRIERFID